MAVSLREERRGDQCERMAIDPPCPDQTQHMLSSSGYLPTIVQVGHRGC